MNWHGESICRISELQKAEQEPEVQSHHNAGCPSSDGDEFDDSDDPWPWDMNTTLSSSDNNNDIALPIMQVIHWI